MIMVDKEKEKEKEEPEIYRDVASQIRDTIRNGLISDKGFTDETQRKIVEILKQNFNKSDEQMGKILMEDTNMLNVSTGKIIVTPLCLVPAAIMYGFRPISSKLFPNYNIYNNYIGYTDEGKFHKTKKGIIERLFTRDNILSFLILAIMLIILLKSK